jgi:hypothetical protein
MSWIFPTTFLPTRTVVLGVTLTVLEALRADHPSAGECQQTLSELLKTMDTMSGKSRESLRKSKKSLLAGRADGDRGYESD